MSETVIMNFTHTYAADDFETADGVWIDCTDITGTNCYCDAEAQEKLRLRIAPYSAAGIHFIDSGNYHYLSKLWAEKIAEPFSLVLFDHHPDMQPPRFEGVLSCGGWVRALLEESRWLQRVYIIGASIALKTEMQGYEGRLHYITEEEAISFPQLGKNFFLTAEEKIYLSIDKDVLATSEVHTNWDQGSLSLQQLTYQLQCIFRETQVIGADVCGEDPELADAAHKTQNRAVNRTLHHLLNSYL